MTLTDPQLQTSVLEAALEAARHRIEVNDEELDEARHRRNRIATALKKEFPGSRTYNNGSVAHGDALNPLNDVDLGVVIPDPDNKYGPGRRGPADLKERAAESIRRELGPDYDDLRVEVDGHKRSILVRFRQPVTEGQRDFTADVIVAIDNPGAKGLFIPRWDAWDRSDPEEHTRLVREANANTASRFARVVRLAKHWSRRHDKPLCSWNIKALAFDSVVQPGAILPGLRDWFAGSIRSLEHGLTPDPAGVAEQPIKLGEGFTRTEVLAELRDALALLDAAISFERRGYPATAIDKLAQLFYDPEMLPFPPSADVKREGAAMNDGRKPTEMISATTAKRPIPARAWAP
ncbi:nucleotidyltransferase [Agromyces sp. NPDC127015]|uniref:nucleotidyltransferase n=1 Tax=Agromyces sp. NPDC127015 TaxID=3347108 RepID=UPI00364E0C98